MGGGRVGRQVKHEVRGRDTTKRTQNLGHDVRGDAPPRQPTLGRIRQGYGGVEVGAGNGPKRPDERLLL